MKHLYLLSIILISTITLSAQTRFAAPGAKWCTSSAYPSGFEVNDPLYSIDSIIDNIPCSYIAGLGCLYVLNDTVYNIEYNSGNTEFLYDYGAQVGDKWLIRNLYYRMNSYDSLIPLRVDSLNKFIIGNDTLRIIHTSGDTLDGNDYLGYGLRTLLEGVGSTEYTFRPGPWGWYDSGIPYLMCYSDSSHGAITGFHLQPLDSCSCRFSTAINELEEGQVSIVHSQSQHAVNISFLQNTKASITIYNVQGQQLSRDEVHASTHSINTTGYTTGVYLCTVIIEGYRPYTKKIVVQQ